MSSRYQPPPRSPPRFSERRPSVGYGALGPRNSENPNQTPLDRAPPRGPKAQYDGPPRGRGGFPRGSFGGRSDYRDRERDARPPMNPDRRDEGRSDWQRRDRDFGSGDRGGFAPRGGRGYIDRDRSASPVRARRGSSEALSIHNARPDGPPTFYGPSARGGYGGRGGRGDWDRNRGRGSFVGERERDFLPRSASREDFTLRDRDRGREIDSDRKERPERRVLDTSRDRDLKPRDHDVWQRDRSIGRQSSGSGPNSGNQQMQNRGEQNPPASDFDPSRRRSTAFTPGIAARDWRRDGETLDYFGRSEQPRDTPLGRKLSPPPAPPSAAASALDYGPPPAVKPAENVTETPSASRDIVTRVEPSATLLTSFLPPTGPKAERPAIVSSQAPPHKPSNEQWTKSESQPRTLRPAPAARVSDQGRPADQGRDGIDIERPPQTSVPSGPRASLMTNKPRPTQQSANTLHSATGGPTPAVKATPVDFRASIPTGPRSERDGLKARPGPPWPTGNATWTSPDYKPRPSIMNNLQSKPPFDGRDPHRPPMSAFNQPQKPRFQPPIIPRSRPVVDYVKQDEGSARVVLTDDNGRLVKPEEGTDSAVDVDMSLNPSSEDELDDDDLDEEDFAESEDKFLKEMKQLESMKPPRPLEDSAIVELLLKIQFLGLIIEGVPLQAIEPPIDVPYEFVDEIPITTGLLSPEERPEEQLLAPLPRRVLGRPLSKPPINPIPTPPLEDLPYLSKSVPQFEVFEESDDEVQHEAVITAMRTEFEKAAWQLREDIDELHSFYNDHYPNWKRTVAELDRIKLDAKQPSPRPATPVPAIPVIVAQPPTTERLSRASMRNATEYDLEKVMEESKLMEQERKEAREREAAELEASGARPNYDSEAVVPDMIEPSERDLSAFRDENWRVPPAQALEVFEYIPPVDDFTEEEQVVFTKAFVAQPKRWGRVAESLPRRDYKQCIMHYYLTKNEAAYKEIVRLSQPKRRRGRLPTKPRALGDLALSYDGGPTAVTDSGRPRRAAAPTFGEVGTDSEALTPAPPGAKRGPRAADPSAQIGEKPARAKKVGTGTTKRRTKKVAAELPQQVPQTQHDIAGTAMSPQKVQPPTPRVAAQRVKEMPFMVEPVQAMDVQTSIEQDVVHAPAFQDMEPNNNLTGFPSSSTVPQITSYWSVPEQQKFPELITYFGRDFAAIAEFMKTKSSTMIKNFYTRELNTGKKELEDAAIKTEGMRERGEPMGPPPTPVAPPKRRYEATPSMASLPRPMANLNLVAPESMHGVVATGATMIDEFPANTIQRNPRGDLVAKPRTSRDSFGQGVHQSTIQQRVEEAIQPVRSQILEPRQSQGPRPGFFPQERVEIRPASQGLRTGLQEQPSLLQGGRAQESLAHFEQLQQHRSTFLPQSNLQSGHEAQSRVQAHAEAAGRLPSYQAESVSQLQSREGLGQARRDSAGMSISQLREQWERDGDPASFRREPSHRGLQYPPVSSQQSQPSFQTSTDPRREVPRPASTPLTAPAEPQKPAPAKRSDIFNLLDNGPSEPVPPKRASLEGSYTQSGQSPSLSALANESLRQRQPPRSTTPLAGHGQRSYLPTATSRPSQQHSAEYNTPFSGSPAPNASREVWLSRFDPRQQSGNAEQTPVQIHQSAGQYGNSLSTGGRSRLAMEMPARQEPSHRSTLSQLQHPGLISSPPPQLSARAGGLATTFRSGSSSSQQQQQQHSRVTSLGYPRGQSQTLSGQPGSAGSTPVSALHQRLGSLGGYDDQRFAPQQEQQLREQQVQIREHHLREQQARDMETRQREYDAQQQLQQSLQQQFIRQQRAAQELEQERYRYPGDHAAHSPQQTDHIQQDSSSSSRPNIPVTTDTSVKEEGRGGEDRR